MHTAEIQARELLCIQQKFHRRHHIRFTCVYTSKAKARQVKRTCSYKCVRSNRLQQPTKKKMRNTTAKTLFSVYELKKNSFSIHCRFDRWFSRKCSSSENLVRSFGENVSVIFPASICLVKGKQVYLKGEIIRLSVALKDLCRKKIAKRFF